MVLQSFSSLRLKQVSNLEEEISKHVVGPLQRTPATLSNVCHLSHILRSAQMWSWRSISILCLWSDVHLLLCLGRFFFARLIRFGKFLGRLPLSTFSTRKCEHVSSMRNQEILFQTQFVAHLLLWSRTLLTWVDVQDVCYHTHTFLRLL